MTIFVHLFIRHVIPKGYHIDIKYHMKLNITISVLFGQKASLSKSNRLHVVSFQVFFVNLKHIPIFL